MRTLLALAFALALALPLTGCIQNAKDLKDKLGAGDAGTALSNASIPVNITKANASAHLPPVARIAVYGQNGALLYKATFVAENATAPLAIDADANLTFVATDSEAFGGATLTYAWSLAGKAATGSKAIASWSSPGLYPIVLTVTDSSGLADEQSITLAIPPKPFDVTKNVTTSQVAGVLGMGQAGTAKFDVALADAGMPATLQGVKVVVAARDTCDVVLSVKDKDGKAVGASDKGGIGTAESADLGAIPEGSYDIEVTSGDPCVEADGVPVSVVLTFVPILDGLSGVHAGHHH
jgi:hypothetical protein